MTVLSASLDAVAFCGPGAPSWEAVRELLTTDSPWTPDPEWSPAPACLPPRAAKRLSPQIRLALAAAEAIGPALPPDAAWVFASSTGEGETLHVILEAQATPEMLVQPLRFQNAVHNAAAGQWTIAAGLKGAVTSLAAFDQTAGAGLLKALVQIAVEGVPVGLVVYDAPLPPPLDEKRPLGQPLAAAFALMPEPTARTLARLAATPGRGAPDRPATAAGEALAATGNPVSALLPLLELLASGRAGETVLGLHGGASLALRTEPCR